MSGVAAALRIIWDSFSYRVRAREANNLPVTVSMMLAFRLPWPDVLYRSAYALLLNVYVYLINDVCDLELDLASSRRDQRTVQFLAAHRRAGLGGLFGLAGLLLAGGLVHSWLLTVAFVANSVIIYAYSTWLKRVPFVDLVVMALAGASMTMVGMPARPLGFELLGLLALLCSGYEVIQVIRDEPDDREHGVRSTAVLLGAGRAAHVFRVIVLASALYGALIVGSVVALALLVGLFFPLTPERAPRTWDFARVLFGSVWLLLLAQVFLGQIA